MMNKFLLLMLVLCACETNRFDSDKRQVLVKNSIRDNLKRPFSGFNVDAFKEDTVTGISPEINERMIRYTIQFSYRDTSGKQVHKTGLVHFAKEGITAISTQIVDSTSQP